MLRAAVWGIPLPRLRNFPPDELVFGGALEPLPPPLRSQPDRVAEFERLGGELFGERTAVPKGSGGKGHERDRVRRSKGLLGARMCLAGPGHAGAGAAGNWSRLASGVAAQGLLGRGAAWLELEAQSLLLYYSCYRWAGQ